MTAIARLPDQIRLLQAIVGRIDQAEDRVTFGIIKQFLLERSAELEARFSGPFQVLMSQSFSLSLANIARRPSTKFVGIYQGRDPETRKFECHIQTTRGTFRKAQRFPIAFKAL
ncbi:MAG: hypothetical protein WCA10_17905 [Terracidiphilus sp.]